MITGLLHAHSGLRYLVLLAGVVALAYALYGWLTRRHYDRGMRITGSTFAGLLHLQVVLGFVMLVSGRWALGGAIIGHLFLMLFAAVVAQLPLSVMRRRPPEARTYPPHAVCALVSLALIWLGVASIGRGLLEARMF
jgi:hypothetical protein